MSRKLLTKTLRLYAGYSAIVIVITSLLFYFFLKNLYQEEVHEHLHQEYIAMLPSLKTLRTNELTQWNQHNSSVQLIRSKTDNRIQQTFAAHYFNQAEQEYVPYQVLDSPIPIQGQWYILRIKASLLENEDLIESIVFGFALLLVLLLGGIILITQLVSAKLWRPFYHTIRGLEHYEINQNTDIQLIPTTVEEFQRLNTTVKLLIQKNKEIFNDQRQFVENAAHELQTPIAILNSQLNLLAQTSDLTEEQAQLIDQMERSNQRFNHLNKNLLLLSKLASESSEKEWVNFSQLIQQYVELFEDQFAFHSITCEVKTTVDLRLFAHRFSLESLVENLLSNALKHNETNGRITIELTQQQCTISNSGNNNALDPLLIFQRFQRATSSSTGTGLGLAIVEKIVHQHDWSIHYSFQHTLHHFSIHFEE